RPHRWNGASEIAPCSEGLIEVVTRMAGAQVAAVRAVRGPRARPGGTPGRYALAVLEREADRVRSCPRLGVASPLLSSLIFLQDPRIRPGHPLAQRDARLPAQVAAEAGVVTVATVDTFRRIQHGVFCRSPRKGRFPRSDGPVGRDGDPVPWRDEC